MCHLTKPKMFATTAYAIVCVQIYLLLCCCCRQNLRYDDVSCIPNEYAARWLHPVVCVDKTIFSYSTSSLSLFLLSLCLFHEPIKTRCAYKSSCNIWHARYGCHFTTSCCHVHHRPLRRWNCWCSIAIRVSCIHFIFRIHMHSNVDVVYAPVEGRKRERERELYTRIDEVEISVE